MGSNHKMSTSQLACTYAALILHDDEMAITAENIKTLVNAANVEVETYWPGLFAKALDGKDINDLLTTLSSAGGGGGAAAAVEEKKKSSSSSDAGDVGGAGMFDE